MKGGGRQSQEDQKGKSFPVFSPPPGNFFLNRPAALPTVVGTVKLGYSVQVAAFSDYPSLPRRNSLAAFSLHTHETLIQHKTAIHVRREKKCKADMYGMAVKIL